MEIIKNVKDNLGSYLSADTNFRLLTDKLVYEMMVERQGGLMTRNGSVPINEVFSVRQIN